MRTRKTTGPRFAICIENSEYPASLEMHKIYRVLPDNVAKRDDLLRVVDESGEDYLYPADYFVLIGRRYSPFLKQVSCAQCSPCWRLIEAN